MQKKKSYFITQAAMIAAVYVVLTVFINAFNLASGAIQIRISEALAILPVFTPSAIPGLFIGCIISNIATGCMPFDVVFGSLATLIGALGTYALRKKPFLSVIPPILSNAIIIPIVLIKVYKLESAYLFLLLTVGAGEIISVGILGTILFLSLKKYKNAIFK